MKPPKLTVIEPGANVTGPPRELGLSGTALWKSIQGHYRIDDAGGTEMLLQACEASDTVAALQSAIDQDGSVIRTARPKIASGAARAFGRPIFRCAHPAAARPRR
jgi:hypothetical protein